MPDTIYLSTCNSVPYWNIYSRLNNSFWYDIPNNFNCFLDKFIWHNKHTIHCKFDYIPNNPALIFHGKLWILTGLPTFRLTGGLDLGFFLWMKSCSFSSLGAAALANFLFLFNAAWLKRFADLIKEIWYQHIGLY